MEDIRNGAQFAPTYRCAVSVPDMVGGSAGLARHAQGMLHHLTDGASITLSASTWGGASEHGVIIESQTYNRAQFLGAVADVARSVGAVMVHVQAWEDGQGIRSTHWDTVADPEGRTVRI